MTKNRSRKAAIKKHFIPALTALLLPGLLLLMLAFLSGCVRSPATTYYILDSAESTPSLREDQPDQRPRVQLRRVDIPAYLDRNAIVTRDKDGVRLTLAEFHAWAESLSGGSQRLLSEVLTPLLLKQGILLQTLDDDVRGPLQIFVQLQRFEGTLGGDVVLDARWTLRDSNDRSLARGSVVDKEAAGATYDSLVLAQSVLLRRMGESMSESLVQGVKLYQKQ